MKPEIKKRWLKALRSGQYGQASGRLTDGKGFCCLGVLCNLHALETGEQWETDRNGDVRYRGERMILPAEVREWAGLVDANPHVARWGLASYNDGDSDVDVAPHSFSQIAKLIAKHL